MTLIAWIITGIALAITGWMAWRFSMAQRTLNASFKSCQQLALSLTKAIDDVVLILDPGETIVFANDAAIEMLGPDLVGRPLSKVLDHPELKQLSEDARRVRGEGVERRIQYETRILNARGMMFYDGETPFETVVLRDITEYQRLERARRDLVSNISHELSTPITAIGLLADTLVNSALKEKPKRIRKMATDIRQQVDTLVQLVQEMRDLSLIESGQMPIRLTPTDLESVVRISIEPLLPLAENKEQTITFDLPEGICVLADDLQIRRAIKNIVHNAIKFSPDSSTIIVKSRIKNDEAVVSVQDSGPGIPEADLPRIFERFFQVDRARRNGTGLGLAIVRHIVLAHGGRAWAESTEGTGATFFITLALSDVPFYPHSN